jgi:hypothetical protein
MPARPLDRGDRKEPEQLAFSLSVAQKISHNAF